MPRYLRYLRIAFCITCGVACVLLVLISFVAFMKQQFSGLEDPYIEIETYWKSYGYLSLTSGLLAIIIGIRPRWKFSLRTLLIATALVAVVLGLVMYLT